MAQGSVVLDATVLTSLQTCELKMDLRHNMQVVPIEFRKKSLEKGSLVHVILAEYYKSMSQNIKRAEAIERAIGAGDDYFVNGEIIPASNGNPATREPLTDTDPEDYALVLDTMALYFEKWKNDSFTVLEVENVRRKIIYQDDEVELLWKAKYDLVADYPDGQMSTDHKTMSRNYGDYIALDNQFMGQCLLLNSRKIIVNRIGFQTTLPLEKRFIRQMICYSQEQLAEFAETAGYYAKYLLALNEQKYFPPRYTSCKNQYGICEYYDHFCSQNRSMRTDNLRQHFKHGRVWDVDNV